MANRRNPNKKQLVGVRLTPDDLELLRRAAYWEGGEATVQGIAEDGILKALAGLVKKRGGKAYPPIPERPTE